MTGPKTNERDGTRAVLRHARLSPYKVREVLDLVRGRPGHEAEDILRFSERDAGFVVGKLLRSAVANAENNDNLDPEELYVSACFADEGPTIKRWRPRARGRATRIRKRTTHITVIVSRLPEEDLLRLQAHRRSEQLAQRSRRVSLSRRIEGDSRNRSDRRRGVEVDEHDHDHEEDGEVEGLETEGLETDGLETEAPETETAESEGTETEATGSEAEAPESEAPESEGTESQENGSQENGSQETEPQGSEPQGTGAEGLGAAVDEEHPVAADGESGAGDETEVTDEADDSADDEGSES
jgi:large subunit ribosomal protein L22